MAHHSLRSPASRFSAQDIMRFSDKNTFNTEEQAYNLSGPEKCLAKIYRTKEQACYV